MSAVLRKKIVIFLFIIGTFLSLWGINYPFVGIYNTNNNYLSLAAKNYQRFGIVNLKFFPTYFAGEHFTSGSSYYLHHPILIFLLSAIPIIIFHFQNWSVHATNFLFVVGDAFMIYVIAKELWDKKTAIWAVGLASVFPMATFFWKYIFFEQASMFFSLGIYYLLIRYLKKPTGKLLLNILLLTLFSGFIDWGVLYFLFPLGIFFFTKYKKAVIKPFVIYLLGAGMSLGIFVVCVYVLQHGLKDLSTAIWGRSYTAELTSLSAWPIRLLVISVLRAILYFTPISIAAIWLFCKECKKKILLPQLSLIFIFLYGLLNLIFLPAASWGHSYFLYYFIPFFAFSGGLVMVRLEKYRMWLWCMVGLIILTSVAVNYLKIQQVKKQLWKYDVAREINRTLKPFETIGVVNFAGDVFENYYLHPSQPIEYAKLNDWVLGSSFSDVPKTVYVCAGKCTGDELAKATSLKSLGLVTTYEAGGNEAWLITRRGQSAVPVTEIVRPDTVTEIGDKNIFLRIYRMLRDTLNVGQI